jgi:hypothetical protein
VALLLQLVRALGAVLISALIGLVFFAVSSYFFVNVLTLRHHSVDFVSGGVVLIELIAGVASLALVAWLTVVFYRKFSGTSG